jgi:hypothetical protein
MCTVHINVLAPHSCIYLILSLSISYPYLIKFHDFADNSQKGMKHQNEGWNSGSTGNDFTARFEKNYSEDQIEGIGGISLNNFSKVVFNNSNSSKRSDTWFNPAKE